MAGFKLDAKLILHNELIRVAAESRTIARNSCGREASWFTSATSIRRV